MSLKAGSERLVIRSTELREEPSQDEVKELSSSVWTSMMPLGLVMMIIPTVAIALFFQNLPVVAALSIVLPGLYILAHSAGWYFGEIVTRNAAAKWVLRNKAGTGPFMVHALIGWGLILAIVIFS